jgi:hypothetical protein
MSVSKEVTFQGYKISAYARQYLNDYWVDDYEITCTGPDLSGHEFGVKPCLR